MFGCIEFVHRPIDYFSDPVPHLQVCELGSEQIWFYYRWFQYSHHFVLWLLLKSDFNIIMSLLFILWSIERLYFWVLLIILIVRLIANKVMRMWVMDRLRCELVIGRRKVMRMVMWWVEGRKKERGNFLFTQKSLSCLYGESLLCFGSIVLEYIVWKYYLSYVTLISHY